MTAADGSRHSTPERRGAARIEALRREIAEIEQAELADDARQEGARAGERPQPLRRRILAALAEGDRTPTELAEDLGARKETISRKLSQLRDDGLVEKGGDADDRRRKPYALTLAGEAQLTEHTAFGAPEPPLPLPTEQQELDFMRAAIEHAVVLRRKRDDLEGAAARLERIVERARKIHAHEIWLDAMSELATTVRQNGERDRARALLAEFDPIALGQREDLSPALVIPAAAYRFYGLARLIEDEGGDEAVEYLTMAARHFEELARAMTYRDSSYWRNLQAWSIVSRARGLRARADLGPALARAGEAHALFSQLDEPYGRSYCLFMSGFSLRLLGDYEGAWLHLDGAHRLAAEHRFQRFEVNSLMQMGDVRRHQGRLDEARAMLDEALERSGGMGLSVTQAFAQSSLGAVEFQREHFGESFAALERARELFVECGHRQGLELTERRRAAVARRLARERGGLDARSAFEMIVSALRTSLEFRSPAGVFHTLAEYGWLKRERGEDASEAAKALDAQLDEPIMRDLLRVDPWVPSVLVAFARTAEHTQLLARSQELLRTARQRLAETVAQAREHLEGLPAARAPQIAGPHTELADEMAGEPRVASRELPLGFEELPLAV